RHHAEHGIRRRRLLGASRLYGLAKRIERAGADVAIDDADAADRKPQQPGRETIGTGIRAGTWAGSRLLALSAPAGSCKALRRVMGTDVGRVQKRTAIRSTRRSVPPAPLPAVCEHAHDNLDLHMECASPEPRKVPTYLSF